MDAELKVARERLLALGRERTAAHDEAEARVVVLQWLEALLREHSAAEVAAAVERAGMTLRGDRS